MAEQRSRGRDVRGQAATEVVLSLTFFVIIMLMGVNFGKAFLLKHRAVAAVRFAAWQESRTREPVRTADLEGAGYGGDGVRVVCQAAAGGGGAFEAIGDVASGLIQGVYGSLEDTQATQCRVVYSWRPLGVFLPDASPSGEHVVSLEDWRHEPEKGGGFLEALRQSFSQFLRIVGY